MMIIVMGMKKATPKNHNVITYIVKILWSWLTSFKNIKQYYQAKAIGFNNHKTKLYFELHGLSLSKIKDVLHKI